MCTHFPESPHFPPPLGLPGMGGQREKASFQKDNVQYLGANKKDFNAGEHNFHPGFALDENCAVADLKHIQEDAETAEQQH